MVESNNIKVKACVVGDSTVGKTCLVHHMGYNEFLYRPPELASNLTTKIEEVSLNIVDTCGQDAFRQLRILNYNNVDFFAICFALDNPKSLENAVTFWKREVIACGPPSASIILVGCKSDLRDEKLKDGGIVVKTEEGEKYSKKHDFEGYVECSAILGDNIDKVFMTGIKLVQGEDTEF